MDHMCVVLQTYFENQKKGKTCPLLLGKTTVNCFVFFPTLFTKTIKSITWDNLILLNENYVSDSHWPFFFLMCLFFLHFANTYLPLGFVHNGWRYTVNHCSPPSPHPAQRTLNDGYGESTFLVCCFKNANYNAAGNS